MEQSAGALPGRREEAYFRALFEHANEAILVLDPVGDRILDANHSACRLLDYAYRELLARSSASLSNRSCPSASVTFSKAIAWRSLLPLSAVSNCGRPRG